ncbi:hypothetical protein C8J55DRAFT_515026, partial [Lentinula edodes]
MLALSLIIIILIFFSPFAQRSRHPNVLLLLRLLLALHLLQGRLIILVSVMSMPVSPRQRPFTQIPCFSLEGSLKTVITMGYLFVIATGLSRITDMYDGYLVSKSGRGWRQFL